MWTHPYIMIIKSAEFIKSSSSIELCPKITAPEFAFIGRSNVGKSSLINMLVNRTGLAKTSVKPGETRLINNFLINKSLYLVDLPGYGYASASKVEIAKWGKFIDEYLSKRENLACLFVLVDSRIEPQKIDMEFISNLKYLGIPFVLISTKTDKISKLNIERHIKSLTRELREMKEELPTHFVSSSKTATGRSEILSLIEKINAEWNVDKTIEEVKRGKKVELIGNTFSEPKKEI